MPARHAHAAADAWSSSKPSNDGASPAHRRMPPTRPGPPRHDPAWLALIPPRDLCASGDDDAHAIDTGSERSVTSAARQGSISASEGASDGQHCPDQDVCGGLPRPAAQQPKTEKPIGQHPGPAASCFGGNRTPAGARFPSHLSPFRTVIEVLGSRRSFRLCGYVGCRLGCSRSDAGLKWVVCR